MRKMVAGLGLALGIILASPGVAQARPLDGGTYYTLCSIGRTPDVLGMSDLAAKMTLYRHGFRKVYLGYQKDGVPVRVVTQIPAAGTPYNRCGTVTAIIGE